MYALVLTQTGDVLPANCCSQQSRLSVTTQLHARMHARMPKSCLLCFCRAFAKTVPVQLPKESLQLVMSIMDGSPRPLQPGDELLLGYPGPTATSPKHAERIMLSSVAIFGAVLDETTAQEPHKVQGLSSYISDFLILCDAPPFARHTVDIVPSALKYSVCCVIT